MGRIILAPLWGTDSSGPVSLIVPARGKPVARPGLIIRPHLPAPVMTCAMLAEPRKSPGSGDNLMDMGGKSNPDQRFPKPQIEKHFQRQRFYRLANLR
ncbi:hypothetical protein SAY86_023696 [Trapa natans]|uniref:Uncharacterized protein n=1 Tax=Trapa natans TaxID=22666 RepID=A0AAN7RAG4_TRANT|nr:hypothetical protein SAY86_023696 [Trapa natans]